MNFYFFHSFFCIFLCSPHGLSPPPFLVLFLAFTNIRTLLVVHKFILNDNIDYIPQPRFESGVWTWKEQERDDHSQKRRRRKSPPFYRQFRFFVSRSFYHAPFLLLLQLCVRARERVRVWLSRCSIRSSFWSPLPKWKPIIMTVRRTSARTYARTKENSIKISRFDVKFIMRSVINRWLKMVIDKAFAKDVQPF